MPSVFPVMSVGKGGKHLSSAIYYWCIGLKLTLRKQIAKAQTFIHDVMEQYYFAVINFSYFIQK